MVPRLFHPNHVRVYVAGPRAAMAGLANLLVYGALGLGVLLLIGLMAQSGKTKGPAHPGSSAHESNVKVIPSHRM